MIECSDNYIWYKKRNRNFRKRFLSITLVFVFIVGLILHYKFNVTKQVYKICSDYSNAYCTEAINDSVIEIFSETIKYSDLIILEKDVNGDIVIMTANSQKINLLSRLVAKETLKSLNLKLEKGIPIPWLTFLGVGILSGYGKNVMFKSVYATDAECNFKSTFKSVGINQTLHSIYVEVVVRTNIEVAMNNQEETTINEVLISESVLVGKVPQVYLNGSIFN